MAKTNATESLLRVLKFIFYILSIILIICKQSHDQNRKVNHDIFNILILYRKTVFYQ